MYLVALLCLKHVCCAFSIRQKSMGIRMRVQSDLEPYYITAYPPARRQSTRQALAKLPRATGKAVQK